MGLWAWLWNLGYLRQAPWDIGGPRPELARLVENGKLEPCRTIDLGCGIEENVIYLTQQGFEATGTDISSRAIAKAQRKAMTAKVSPPFLVGDVTDLAAVEGPFDLVVV
ncbi:class I SAM-dependent methyltransferase [Chloroflexota bacterium]